jgi:ribosomal protein S24E|tara:strand:+ start:740 stop:1267 length:528 start_codon:yes stop_codon:yes gene_type:complete
MFFDRLVVSLKLLLLKRKCSRLLLQNPIRPTARKAQISFGLIVDLDSYDADTLVQNIKTSFGLLQQQINVLGYSKSDTANKLPYFKINQDLSWFKGVMHPSVASFNTSQYTYLINFHEHKEPCVSYVSLKTAALIRIGFQEDKTADLIINQSPENTPSLFKVLHNYIQKLTVEND